MKHIQVDKRLKTPYYKQIKQSIIHAIEEGHLKHGHRLPTERELSQFYEVSMIIPKKAYDDLAKEGYLTRIQGKGTFVIARPHIAIDLAQFQSLENLQAYVAPLQRKILLVSKIKESKPEAFRIKALAFKKHYPHYLLQMTMMHLHFDQVIIDEQKSLIEIMNDATICCPLKHTRTLMRSGTASYEEANLLELSPHDPVHRVETRIYNDCDELVAVADLTFPAAYVSFEVTVHD